MTRLTIAALSADLEHALKESDRFEVLQKETTNILEVVCNQRDELLKKFNLQQGIIDRLGSTIEQRDKEKVSLRNSRENLEKQFDKLYTKWLKACNNLGRCLAWIVILASTYVGLGIYWLVNHIHFCLSLIR